MEIKELLYHEINQIGTDYIKNKIVSNILNSEYIIEQILHNCFKSMHKYNFSESDFNSLVESLMHFLLTCSIIPSQRNITINGFKVNILIPAYRNIRLDSTKVLIIQFINENAISSKNVMNNLLNIQPHKENIWLVTYSPSDSFLEFKNFVISYDSNSSQIFIPFSQILIRINEFLEKIKYSGFRILGIR